MDLNVCLQFESQYTNYFAMIPTTPLCDNNDDVSVPPFRVHGAYETES